jgi:uncharacterized repeat protein (TIGR03803 family)
MHNQPAVKSARTFTVLALLIAFSLAPVMAPLVCNVVAASGAALEYQQLKSFGFADLMGQSPESPLIEGTDGALYGTTYGGAPGDIGTVFKINKDGSGYCVLHRFGSIENDGSNPSAALLEASDGALYGTTSRGGSNLLGGQTLYGGTVFKLNKDGSDYCVLHSFGSTGDGENPQAELIEGSDGALYGTTADGGATRAAAAAHANKKLPRCFARRQPAQQTGQQTDRDQSD